MAGDHANAGKEPQESGRGKAAASDSPLLRFYRGHAPDSEGRTFEEILAWPDDALEYTHDFIQWLFPMTTASAFNPDAPILDAGQITAFRSEAILQTALARAFKRMARFYGFDVADTGTAVSINLSATWNDRKVNWLRPGNHNLLRITRILTSLRLLGLDGHAAAFFETLTSIYRSEEGSGIGAKTFGFWTSAATSLPRL